MDQSNVSGFDCFQLLLVSSATSLLEMSARVWLILVTNCVFREKQSSKICIFGVIMESKNGGVQLKQILFFREFSNLDTLFQYIFSGSNYRHFIESNHQSFFEG